MRGRKQIELTKAQIANTDWKQTNGDLVAALGVSLSTVINLRKLYHIKPLHRGRPAKQTS